jgi:glycosyltransferase involved in cell wall biosynthesis
VLGLVARFEAGKGHEFLIDAVSADARLREKLHFVFVGRGCTAPRLRDRLASAGLMKHATLLEAQPEIERIYAACDAVVLPSAGEAFPMTVIEAAAMGKPVVASRVGDVPAIGFPEAHLFDAGDTEGCARALHHALDAPASHAESQRAIAERFDIYAVRRRYAGLYRELAGAAIDRRAS